LTATFPRQLVDEVVDETGKREQRTRLLPAHLTVYYVLAMTLFSSSGYEEVMRSLTEGLTWTSDGEDEYELPSQVAITKARARLGPKPLELLFARACVPLATRSTKGAFYRDWRLVSIDGTTIDVADTPANAEVLGRAGTGRGDGSAFPQLRIVALGECGTHAVIAAVMDSYAVVEQTLAKRLLPALQPGVLCLADRGFSTHPMMSAAAKTGADLLWRAKGNAVLPVLERYPDGSFRSELVASTDKRRREDVLAVRVIEYSIDDPGRPGEAHVGDSVGVRDRVGGVVRLDPDAASAEIGELQLEVGDSPGELGLGVGGPRRAERHRQLRAGAAAEDDPLIVLAQDLETERGVIEVAALRQVLRQEDREYEVVAEHELLPSLATREPSATGLPFARRSC